MIAETGHYALCLALVAALLQGTIPLIGAARKDAAWAAWAVPLARAQLLGVGVAFIAITAAFVSSDFSVSLVAQNSHTEKPMLYKISGVWGNHEGSMLLWALITALFGAAVGEFGRNLPGFLRARVIGVQGLVGLGVLGFLIFTSNPFLRLVPVPVDGRGLNPMLQDPGLAFHPPLLYLGYVGFSLVFSFAVAALLEGRVDAAWARWARPWTLAAWAFLTAGIGLGSWWAYYELGWGGWWFWDPVENASLLPWLLGTALLHSVVVTEKRDALKRWTVLLAILTFALSLIGTFLVRSGVITSVHAFAVDPARGLYILGLLVVYIGGALGLYAWRAPLLRSTGGFETLSRESALVVNNLLLAVAAATVLLGTIYPLILDAMGGGQVSVGAPYFNAVFVPIMLPLLMLTATGPLLAWRRADAAAVLKRLSVAGIGAFAAGILAFALRGGPWVGALAAGVGVWLILAALVDLAERSGLGRVPVASLFPRLIGLPRSAFGTAMAHAGLGVVVLGMVGSIHRVETITTAKPGDVVRVGDYALTFDGVKTAPGPNYQETSGSFRTEKNGQALGVLTPSKRIYHQPPMPTTEAAIDSTALRDLYVVLGEPDPAGGGWGVKAYVTPLASWLWVGSVVMGLGGLVSMTDRRRPRRATA